MAADERVDLLKRRIQWLLAFFIVGLVLSGLTALPLENELRLTARWLGASETASAEDFSGVAYWVVKVRNALKATYANHPFIAYGTDWLAFAHFAIAIFFVGPLKDPVRNVWVILAGLAACILVIPFALVCGAIRGIPIVWRIIDCSFGVVGSVPLWICLRYIWELENILSSPSQSQQIHSSEN